MAATDSEITIEKLIVHKVDHEKYDAPLLSDKETPANEDVKSFLRGHITNNREHENTRTAKFDVSSNGQETMAQLCDATLSGGQFVEKSQALAHRLFSHLDGRTSPCDLVICSFTEGNSTSQWLTLLKMDPEEAFIAERTKDESGAYYVELQRVDDVLPTELQKCAFILPADLRKKETHDLFVLDQQISRYRRKRPIASFFSRDFLECDVNLNARDKTFHFYQSAQQYAKTKEDSWSDKQRAHFHSKLRVTLKDTSVNTADFAETTIEEEDEQHEFLDYLEDDGFKDKVFTPDSGVGDKLTKHKKFEGDDGIRLRIEAEAMDKVTVDYDEDTGMHTVTIRTARWDEIL